MAQASARRTELESQRTPAALDRLRSGDYGSTPPPWSASIAREWRRASDDHRSASISAPRCPSCNGWLRDTLSRSPSHSPTVSWLGSRYGRFCRVIRFRPLRCRLIQMAAGDKTVGSPPKGLVKHSLFPSLQFSLCVNVFVNGKMSRCRAEEFHEQITIPV